VAFARIPLDKAKRAKDVLEVKLNDIVLAVCSGTLRRYLELHDDLPPEPLIAMCPISVRTDDGTREGGNQVSGMWASLATDVDDPGERLRMIAASTQGAKSDHDRIGAQSLTDWAEWSAPRTFGLAARLYSSMHVADNLGPIHNTVISNVPGPPFPLYLSGAELVAAYPMGPIMDGCALNITVLSYRDHIDIGFLVDADLVPDPWELAAQVEPAFEEILKLGEAVDPTLTKSAAPVVPTSKSEKARSTNGAKAKQRRKGDPAASPAKVR
jgi:WS/DGAT/MGAT family acyltransferase